ncbi:threonine--tRNA ligase [Spongiactinospora sp. TRM90649]|uniref:threonine--tRNA ligase n=1 Tax=Spongiactinospora sp. TRM90649 TaxID=3031114 RepID=UPI0023F6BFBA|nr:threonine--tRNA ligase [Spongiactinospora sp. TRM90649]MDF5754515.1 threonine--tRNA ligase [Spongiactinospora sp. TRM90649]
MDREETAMHDHRRLGRELELFGTDPLIGAGLPYWLPAGAAVRQALEDYVREAERRAGYRHVYSPVLGKKELYRISGHWAHYSEDMFPPMSLGAEEMVLRPSLCPHHALIFRSRGRSYRELPLRMAELGAMYRSEPSGVLGGLTRVRSIQLNDAHVFCTLDQAVDEARAALEMIGAAHRDLGVRPVRHRLSLPGPGGKYVANPEMWERAGAMLADVLDKAGIEYEAAEGEAAFYGPKIDVQIADPAGRETTLSTVQIDFHQPEVFGLSYTGADGGSHRPVMVHRSVIGSVERLVAHLIEHYAGAFPGWLAPVQVVALPLSDAEVPDAAALVERCVDAGLRAELAGPVEGGLGARIRQARLVPYQAVIGPREVADGAVALRLRDGRRLDPLPVAEAVDRIGALTARRSAELWDAAA